MKKSWKKEAIENILWTIGGIIMMSLSAGVIVVAAVGYNRFVRIINLPQYQVKELQIMMIKTEVPQIK